MRIEAVLAAALLAIGASWAFAQSGDARYTLETSDGALIYVRNHGYRHGPADVLQKLAAGEDVDPALYYMRTSPLFETGDARYSWLNRLICVGTGARRKSSVHLEIFEVK